MILEYTANSALGEIRSLAAPAAQAGVFLSQGVENHASFASLAARQTTRALRLMAIVVAIELIAAVRATRLRGAPPRGQGTRATFDRAAQALSAEMADRPLTSDLDAAICLIQQDGFT
jgi:histidine ammonia-lyase